MWQVLTISSSRIDFVDAGYASFINGCLTCRASALLIWPSSSCFFKNALWVLRSERFDGRTCAGAKSDVGAAISSSLRSQCDANLASRARNRSTGSRIPLQPLRMGMGRHVERRRRHEAPLRPWLLRGGHLGAAATVVRRVGFRDQAGASFGFAKQIQPIGEYFSNKSVSSWP
jgi:hypothetical protein